MVVTLSANPADARAARQAILKDPAISGLPEKLVADVMLVLSELASNAIASSPANSTILLDWWRDGNRLWLQVGNQGHLTGAMKTEMPDALRARGRGLAISRLLASELSIRTEVGTVTVCAAFDICA